MKTVRLFLGFALVLSPVVLWFAALFYAGQLIVALTLSVVVMAICAVVTCGVWLVATSVDD